MPQNKSSTPSLQLQALLEAGDLVRASWAPKTPFGGGHFAAESVRRKRSDVLREAARPARPTHILPAFQRLQISRIKTAVLQEGTKEVQLTETADWTEVKGVHDGLGAHRTLSMDKQLAAWLRTPSVSGDRARFDLPQLAHSINGLMATTESTTTARSWFADSATAPSNETTAGRTYVGGNAASIPAGGAPNDWKSLEEHSGGPLVRGRLHAQELEVLRWVIRRTR
ncbi:hypothetical protein AURDEDRAFT_161006 [Auricularia subglabra TFB-10046 SS5]|nr:hypothetical protein AURDEDRAFT_161006 [Auricularia subglabra TFB-10046 SS5]